MKQDFLSLCLVIFYIFFPFFKIKINKKIKKYCFLICKKTNAHTKTNARGSFETNLFFNLALEHSLHSRATRVEILVGSHQRNGTYCLLVWGSTFCGLEFRKQIKALPYVRLVCGRTLTFLLTCRSLRESSAWVNRYRHAGTGW